ncbi:hypothetical protein [Nonomuraea sp. NPDC049625]|uniref:hypothetical protein n=1 Tax=Nonomuraea sp. NPDC049625 TaxID=3155775 RepID=UPI003412C062
MADPVGRAPERVRQYRDRRSRRCGVPGAASLEEYLKSIRDASDFVLEERQRVAAGGGAPGYVLRSSYVEYASDMESFPTGETVLFVVTGHGQLLKVRYICALVLRKPPSALS